MIDFNDWWGHLHMKGDLPASMANGESPAEASASHASTRTFNPRGLVELAAPLAEPSSVHEQRFEGPPQEGIAF